jgi:hypothetical protein
VHLAASELAGAIGCLARVVRPGGWVAVALHVGAQVHHVDSWFDVDVDLDFVLHDPDQVRAAMSAAGLHIVEWYLRGPVEGEVSTERIYVLAQRR